MSLQLLRGAQSTRRFGENAQTVLIGFFGSGVKASHVTLRYIYCVVQPLAS